MPDEPKKDAYPRFVYLIVGHEFCERFAYYGMRSVLILYLRNFLNFDNDLSTIVYHSFVALCYLFPIMGGILSDSYWGKVKTVMILAQVNLLGMVILTVSSVPKISGHDDPQIPGTANIALMYVGLFITALGNGGIKPCVSSLGGDQFEGTQDEQAVTSFFAMFYGAINAGSLISIFVSPILREDVECFDREDCFFAAFLVPTIMMFVSVIVFLIGRSKYICHKPTGNVFVNFCRASWSGIKGKITSKEKKDHFMDYAEGKHSKESIRDAKYVFPLIVMFLPMPFFWALFDMKGSRWVLSATQTNGWVGGDLFKIKPDQMQIANPILILIFLPIFTKCIYPCLRSCGVNVTLLRRMSVGQVVTALSFVMAGLVQYYIEKDMTSLPYYGHQNAVMVLNGVNNKSVLVESEYWQTTNVPDGVTPQTKFVLDDYEWRTETFDWISDNNPSKMNLLIDETTYTFGTSSKVDFRIADQTITGLVYYVNETSGIHNVLQYISPQEKSETIRVKCILVNPTKYWIYPSLRDYNSGTEIHLDFNGNNGVRNQTILQGYDVITEGAEMEQGIYKIKFHLYESGDASTKSQNLTDFVTSCETEIIMKPNRNLENPNTDDYLLLPGSIWTMMVTVDEENNCTIHYGKDSNENAINILWLVPQYFIITVGEVMNSATGNEFAYTQAPASMKSVVGSLWFLTTCIGNILDIFFVEVKLYPTQTGEYLCLALIMFGASLIFILLSIFYYEYVPEGAFSDLEDDTDEKKNDTGDDFQERNSFTTTL